MLHGATVRSTISRGEILSIRHDFGRDGFTVVDFRDIPGRNVVALIEDDQPCLAEREVRHAAEPILLLAHEEKEMLASPKVEIEYRAAEPVYDPAVSQKIFKEILIEKGRLEPASGRRTSSSKANTVSDSRSSSTSRQTASHGAGNGGVTVYGSLQCPYYVHKALRVLLGLPPRHGPDHRGGGPAG
jgi:xanthine dehydrogenase molybdopterin-binding subunit B